jgi:hypothetical protein
MGISELLRGVTGARETLHERFNELRQQGQRLRRERELLAALPRPRKEVIEIVEGMIGSYRQRYLDALAMYVHRLDLRNPTRGLTPQAVENFNPLALDDGGERTSGDLTMLALAGLLDDHIQPAIRQALEDMSYPTRPGQETTARDAVGPPMAERQRRLEELAGQIKAIDLELGELRRQAMESGLDVSKLHMPGAL